MGTDEEQYGEPRHGFYAWMTVGYPIIDVSEEAYKELKKLGYFKDEDNRTNTRVE